MRELPAARRADRPATRSGMGMLMITVYGIFAVASSARAIYQVATKLDGVARGSVWGVPPRVGPDALPGAAQLSAAALWRNR